MSAGHWVASTHRRMRRGVNRKVLSILCGVFTHNGWQMANGISFTSAAAAAAAIFEHDTNVCAYGCNII